MKISVSKASLGILLVAFLSSTSVAATSEVVATDSDMRVDAVTGATPPAKPEKKDSTKTKKNKPQKKQHKSKRSKKSATL